MVAHIKTLKSYRLRSSVTRIGATSANSISALPVSLAILRAGIPTRRLSAILAATRREVRSLDKGHRANGVGWEVEACCGAASFGEDVTSAIYRDVVDHQSETRSSIARFVDGAAER